jgi:dipeptidyl aminopeptidase/acylaminoacyl peptidase
MSRGLVASRIILLAAFATACDSPFEPPDTGVDLDRLFAPPTAAEMGTVEADWAARAPAAESVRVEFTGSFPLAQKSMQLSVVSHVVDGHRHYGAILVPAVAGAQGLPLLLYLHGGDAGVAVEELQLLVSAAGDEIAEAVWVVPSFRSESLRAGTMTWQSGGEPSPWDRDVDDALALLDVALAFTPVADAGRIGTIGQSRGGGVALLMSARDPRIRATVEFFGPTDFFGTFIRDVVADALRGQLRPLPGLSHLNTTWLQPLRRGDVTYEATRLAMLRRSPAWFVARLGPVQLHHGTADAVVHVSQAQRLSDAMSGIGRGPPDFEAYLYPGVGHSAFAMTGAAARVTAFLGRLRVPLSGDFRPTPVRVSDAAHYRRATTRASRPGAPRRRSDFR